LSRRVRRAAVLGGSGFIGFAIVEELLRRGYSVTTVSRGRTPADFSGSVARIRADREDPVGYARALAGVEAEAVIDVTAYLPGETKAALEAFRGRVGRFVHISTLSVYAWPFPCPVAEDWPLEPDSARAYGFGKAECERAVQAVSTADLPWTILRLPAVFGPRDPHYREAGLFRRISSGGPVYLPPRPYLCQNLYVGDAARAAADLLESPVAPGRAYNAGGPPFLLEDYAGLLAEIMGKPLVTVRASRRVLEREGLDPDRTPYWFEGDLVLNTRRILEETGFRPEVGLERGLRLSLDWLAGRDAALGEA
jgi:2'-hydroxyisoflavone reductase